MFILFWEVFEDVEAIRNGPQWQSVDHETLLLTLHHIVSCMCFRFQAWLYLQLDSLCYALTTVAIHGAEAEIAHTPRAPR